MPVILPIHILAGALGLLSGYVALSAAKGGSLHRKSGMLFVCVMLTMAVTGMMISALGGVAPEINIPSAALTSYLVITSLLTVRPPSARARQLNAAAMIAAFAIGAACVGLAIAAIGRGDAASGMAYPLVMFAAAACGAGAGDRRMIRAGGLQGAPRLKRHLWRMCFALLIASIAFFLGRGRVPETIRTPALIASGVLLPIAAMSYWLWRLRVRNRGRGLQKVTTYELRNARTS